MYKITTVFLVFIVCLAPATAFAASGGAVASSDLIDRAKDYDGQEVTYTGEVIGDIMRRGEYTWINVSDGNNAVGIWVKSVDLADVSLAGRYNAHGDTVEVKGMFRRACAEHGGDFDIHAANIKVVQKGYATPHTLSPLKAVLACILFGGAVACIVILLKRNRKAKSL
jgi:hypothetical protein